MAAEGGIEPRILRSERNVLPLDHISTIIYVLHFCQQKYLFAYGNLGIEIWD